MNTTVSCKVISSKKYVEETGWVITYGLMQTNSQETFIINDISCNYKFVYSLIKKINNNNVSAIHLLDILEDELR